MINIKKGVLFSSLFIGVTSLAACSSGTSGQPQNATANSASPAHAGVSVSASQSSTIGADSSTNSSSKTSKTSVSEAVANSLVLTVSHGNIKVLSVFPSVDGMTGAITQPSGGGQKQIVYITPHGNALFTSGGLDKDGNSLQDKDMVAQNVYISSDKLYDEVKNQSFIVGKSGPIVTAFLDPNCIWCHELYKKLEPHIKNGDVRLRAVMVGFLKQSSEAKAVTILAAKDPAKALAKDEKNFDKANEEGGITPLKTLPEKYVSVVKNNLKAFGEAGPVATPALLYCDKTDDTKLTYLRGMPPDIDTFLKSVSSKGHPSCNSKAGSR